MKGRIFWLTEKRKVLSKLFSKSAEATALLLAEVDNWMLPKREG